MCVFRAASARAACADGRSITVRIAETVWAAGASADLVSTFQFASSYPELREQNPLVSWLRPHPAAMVGALAGIDTATFAGLDRWSRCSPRLAAIAFAALSAGRFYVTARNVNHMRTVDTQRRIGVTLVVYVK